MEKKATQQKTASPAISSRSRKAKSKPASRFNMYVSNVETIVEDVSQHLNTIRNEK